MGTWCCAVRNADRKVPIQGKNRKGVVCSHPDRIILATCLNELRFKASCDEDAFYRAWEKTNCLGDYQGPVAK